MAKSQTNVSGRDVTFFTVVDQSFLPGAIALMRSIREYFPMSQRVIKGYKISKFAQKYIEYRDIAEVLEAMPVSMTPARTETSRQMSFWRFNVQNLPREYYVYMDSDAFLTGRVNELLSVPHGKIGMASERHYNWTLRTQFDQDSDLSIIEDRFSIDLNMPSVNSGVISGHKNAWNHLWDSLAYAKEHEEVVFDMSLGNQGTLGVVLNDNNLLYELPKKCNNLSYETWSGRPNVLHFYGRTLPRPWDHGRSRRDNSYAAFAKWRSFSSVFDFILNGKFIRESIWRSLDDVRPLIRNLRNRFTT